MAECFSWTGREVTPGDVTYGRFRLEAAVTALPGDRYVHTLLLSHHHHRGRHCAGHRPPRFKRMAARSPSTSSFSRRPRSSKVVEEHLRQTGAAGLRAADLRARVSFGPEAPPGLARRAPAGQAITAVDREWYVHHEASDRLRSQTVALLEAFHAQYPLRGGSPGGAPEPGRTRFRKRSSPSS